MYEYGNMNWLLGYIYYFNSGCIQTVIFTTYSIDLRVVLIGEFFPPIFRHFFRAIFSIFHIFPDFFFQILEC